MINYAELIRDERAFTVKLLKGLKSNQWQIDTLCEGWTIEDLVAHLIVRERGGVSARSGIVIPFLENRHSGAIQAQKKVGHKELLTKIEHLPGWGPKLRFNLIEFFVHNEDILRGDLRRNRQVTDNCRLALASFVPSLTKLAFRKIKEPIDIAVVDEQTRDEIVIRRGRRSSQADQDEKIPQLRLIAEPGEFILLCMGRGRHAKIDVAGDARAKEIYRLANIGL
ncbi:MAG: maleylpyruvate isomerase family mycothiol-dependent enzyme [bacterium]